MRKVFLIGLCLQDRFAYDHTMPVIDPHQDWFLDSAKEEDGVTIMEFHRALHTGDSRDLDIPVSSLLIQFHWLTGSDSGREY